MKLYKKRCEIPHKSTSSAGPRFSEDLFVVVCIDLQLANRVQSLLLPRQLAPLGVHGHGVLQGCPKYKV